MQELKEAEHCDEHVRPSVCLFVYLSVSLFVCPLSHQFFPYAALPTVAVARSSSGDVTIYYVLPFCGCVSKTNEWIDMVLTYIRDLQKRTLPPGTAFKALYAKPSLVELR